MKCDNLIIPFKGLLEPFKLGGPGLLPVLLDDDSRFVREELERRLSRGAAKGWDSSSIDAHRREFVRTGIRWQSSQPNKADRQSPWHRTLPARQKDILSLNQPTNTAPTQRARLVVADLGRPIGRAPTSTLHGEKVVSPTLMPGSVLWVSGDPFLPRGRPRAAQTIWIYSDHIHEQLKRFPKWFLFD